MSDCRQKEKLLNLESTEQQLIQSLECASHVLKELSKSRPRANYLGSQTN
jgi:hypothetical protein